MAALLVALAIMAILLSVAMPVWRHEARREKEAELVFRGEQYARAIALFRFKNANNPNVLPPSIDFLVQNRFLRKKYKDPMTADGEFVPLSFGSQTPGINPTSPSNPTPGAGRSNIPTGQAPGAGRSNTPQQPTSPIATGISGVRSKSQETSIRAYRGATRYDQWAFTFNIAPRPGGAMPPANTGDGRGGNPNMPPSGPQRGLNPRSGGPGSRGGRGSEFGPPSPGGVPRSDPGGVRGGPGRGRGF
jgi:type II secretory pathway pseudopilin PulG